MQPRRFSPTPQGSPTARALDTLFPKPSGKNGLEGILRAALCLEKNAALLRIENRFLPSRVGGPLLPAQALADAWNGPGSKEALILLRDALKRPVRIPVRISVRPATPSPTKPKPVPGQPNFTVDAWAVATSIGVPTALLRLGKWLAIGIVAAPGETPRLLTDALALGRVLEPYMGLTIREFAMSAAATGAPAWTPATATAIVARLARDEARGFDIASAFGAKARIDTASLARPDALKDPFGLRYRALSATLTASPGEPELDPATVATIERQVEFSENRRRLAAATANRLRLETAMLARDVSLVISGRATYGRLSRAEPRGDPEGALAWRNIVSDYLHQADRFLADVARSRLLRLTAGLWQAKRTTGAFAMTIPAIPRDPFSSNAFRYVPAANRFDLWSVGEATRDARGHISPARRPLRLL